MIGLNFKMMTSSFWNACLSGAWYLYLGRIDLCDSTPENGCSRTCISGSSVKVSDAKEGF